MAETDNDFRSPEAKARDRFFDSPEGDKLCRGTACGAYLRNRLELAFIAGIEAGKKLVKKTGER